MLDLLFAAEDAAKSPRQKAILQALLDGNDRDMQRVLEDDGCHGELFEEDFFNPFMGLMAAHGDKHAWRTMEGWGYSMDTELDVTPEDGGLTRKEHLGGWACRFLPVERLQELIEEKILYPFEGGDLLKPGEYGMAAGSPEVFDFFRSQWIQHEKDVRRVKGARAPKPHLPDVFSLLNGMRNWQRDTPSAYPDNFPKGAELERRIDGVADAISEIYYDTSQSPDTVWQSILNDPPAHKYALAVALFFERAARHVPEPWKDPDIVERMHASQRWNVFEGALRAGARIDTPFGEKIPQMLVKDILRGNLENSVWNAFCERAQKDAPHVWNALPERYRKKNTSLARAVKQGQKTEKSEVQALLMHLSSAQSGSPAPSRPRLRL